MYNLRVQVCKPVTRVSCIPIDDHLGEDRKDKDYDKDVRCIKSSSPSHT